MDHTTPRKQYKLIRSERRLGKLGVAAADVLEQSINEAAGSGYTVAETVADDTGLLVIMERPGPVQSSGTPDLNDPSTLAWQLRTHAAEIAYWSNSGWPAGLELMHMADRIDGGTGVDAHHGCPDVSIPTAECLECRLVLEAEVFDGRERSVFAPPVTEHD